MEEQARSPLALDKRPRCSEPAALTGKRLRPVQRSVNGARARRRAEAWKGVAQPTRGAALRPPCAELRQRPQQRARLLWQKRTHLSPRKWCQPLRTGLKPRSPPARRARVRRRFAIRSPLTALASPHQPCLPPCLPSPPASASSLAASSRAHGGDGAGGGPPLARSGRQPSVWHARGRHLHRLAREGVRHRRLPLRVRLLSSSPSLLLSSHPSLSLAEACT